eukprot:COSAG06_NODE_270_length_18720_cov_149.982708_7_plen_481_part_00
MTIICAVTIKEQDKARAKEESLIGHKQLKLLISELESLEPTMPCLQMPCTACKRACQRRRAREQREQRARTRSKVVVVGSAATATDGADGAADGPGVADLSGTNTAVDESGTAVPETAGLTAAGGISADGTQGDADDTAAGGTGRLFASSSTAAAAVSSSSSRASSYWVQPWGTPSTLGVDALASTLERLADAHADTAAAGADNMWAAQQQRGGGGRKRRASSVSATASVSDLADMVEEANMNSEGGGAEVYVDYYTVALKLAKAGAPAQRAKEIAAIFGKRQQRGYGAVGAAAAYGGLYGGGIGGGGGAGRRTGGTLGGGSGGGGNGMQQQQRGVLGQRHRRPSSGQLSHRSIPPNLTPYTQQQPAHENEDTAARAARTAAAVSAAVGLGEGLTVAEVVSQTAAQLGITGNASQDSTAVAGAGGAGGGQQLSLAATLDRCMVELGLPSSPAAAGGVTVRQRAAMVAAELGIATGWPQST